MRLIDGLPDPDARIEAVVDLHRADENTVSAAGAGRLINVPGVLLHGNAEVTDRSLNLFYLGTGVDRDTGMPGNVHHLGRQDAHGAVVCGKGLVEHGHVAANSWLTLDEMHMDAMLRDIEGCLDTGNSCPDYYHITHGVHTPRRAGRRMQHCSGSAASGPRQPVLSLFPGPRQPRSPPGYRHLRGQRPLPRSRNPFQS